MTQTKPRFDLHLIADSDLQDIVRFHEQAAFKRGHQLASESSLNDAMDAFEQGKTAGRGEANRLLFVGGVIVGVVVGLLI